MQARRLRPESAASLLCNESTATRNWARHAHSGARTGNVVVARLTEMLVNPLSVLTTTLLRRLQQQASDPTRPSIGGGAARIEGRTAARACPPASWKGDLGDDQLAIKVDWSALCELLGVQTMRPTMTSSARSHGPADSIGASNPNDPARRPAYLVDGRSHARPIDRESEELGQRLQKERGLTVSGLAASEDSPSPM